MVDHTMFNAKLLVLLTAVMVIYGGLTWGAPPAEAAPSCYGDYCSGLNPQTSGCIDANTRAIATVKVAGIDAWVDVIWSPLCKTEWARVRGTGFASCPTGSSYLNAIQSTGYTQTHPNSSAYRSKIGSTLYCWTPMIYSPTLCVRGEVRFSGWGTFKTACA